ncbi:helix-turn-helix domain-containing protein [Chitinophaga solisilvae]|uniref:helix-turn-helix domain-containing protein n=1 Tax=Chitinophaga solisilvae TaxID=1233460 RepID=UPI0013694FD1|nr:helix-turn-helix domain-containing protein [Chitinophaga solisilvae]
MKMLIFVKIKISGNIMLYRLPAAFQEIPPLQLCHSGKSAMAWFRLLDRQDKAEGFLTENTLVFVIRGSKHVHLPQGKIIAGSGDVMLLKRGTYFMSAFLTDGAEYQGLMLCVDDNILRSFLDDVQHVQETQTNIPMVLPCSTQLTAVRDSIISYMQQPGEHTPRLLELKIKEVLLLLLSGKHRAAVLSFLHHLFDTSAENLTMTIRAHLLKPLSLAEYAKICGLSLSAFKREFAKLYQAPPKKWINEEKLKHAHYLLQHTPKNVNEIADECGFESTSYFIRQYKQLYGITPKNTQRTKTATF